MAVDVGSAVGYLDLDISGFLAGLKSAQSEADKQSKNIATKFGENISNTGKKLSSAGATLTKNITLPVAGAGTAIVTLSTKFESSMSKVSAISGATGDDLENLSDKAKEMGAKTKFSASEAADAFTYMAMAGWKTEDMIAGIDGIMNLAAADGLDLATTSDIVTDALTAFGLSAEDSAHFADVLAKASSNANTNVSMLGESFKYAAPVAGALGYSAEDTAIALGLMANAGIKGSQGGTALRASLSRLVKPTDAVAVAMEKYDISLTKSDGSMKTLGEVMDMLRTNLSGLTQAEQAQAAATLFGQEAMSGMLSIINASDSDYNNLTAAIYDADGAAEQMANTMLDNLSGQFTILKSSLEGLALQFGEIILPYFKQFVEWLQKLVQKFQELSPEQKEQIVKWAAILAAIGPVLSIFGKLVSGVGSVITTFGKVPGAIKIVTGGFSKLVTSSKNVVEGFKLAKSGFTALGAQASPLGAALAGVTAPMLAIVAAVALAVAAFVSLWKTNEEFRNNIIAIWDQIKATFEKLTSGIVERLNKLGFDFENIGEVLKAIWKGFCDFLAPIFEGVFQNIAIVFDTFVNVFFGIWDFFHALFTGDWEGCWTAVKSIFESIWNGIKDWFSNVLNMLKGVFDVVLGWFGTSWSECWNGIKSFFENIWNGIISFLSNAWETIKNVVQVGIMFIVELFKAAFQLITLPFRFIWENCKEIIISIWDAIKTKVSTVLDAIQKVIENVWNAVSKFFTTIWTSISNFISSVWDAIKTSITNTINAIKSVIESIFNAIKTTITNIVNAIKTTVTNVFNAIKTAISTALNAAKTTVSNVINNIKTIFSDGLNAAKTTVSNIFDSIKSKIESVINGAKDIVQTGIEKIKSFFNFTWSLPKLKLPHFTIKGKFSLDPPSVPSFGIEWYKKAMGNGIILDAATIFGFNPKTGKFLAGGEAGSETVVGTKSLMSMIKTTVAEAVGPLVQVSRELARTSADLGYVTYNGFAKIKEAGEKQVKYSRDNNGDTFVFYSPKAIDEIEAAKQMKKTKRELAEGF